MDSFREERKYFLNVVPRNTCPVETQVLPLVLNMIARNSTEIQMDESLIGSSITLLHRYAGLRFKCTATIVAVGEEFRSLAGEMQFLCTLRRADDTVCQIGLTLFCYYHHWKNSFDFSWYVV